MFTGEQLLRSVSFGGLLLTLALILHHRSMPLALVVDVVTNTVATRIVVTNTDAVLTAVVQSD
jgi:hypothetical protein